MSLLSLADLSKRRSRSASWHVNCPPVMFLTCQLRDPHCGHPCYRRVYFLPNSEYEYAAIRMPCFINFIPLLKGTGKAVPLQAWTGARRLRLPEFLDNRHMKVASLLALHAGRLYPPPPPRRYSRFSFPLEAESTPGP
jgi:hypothetical protein